VSETVEAVAEWTPYDPCPCGCGVVGWKLRKNGHVVGCKCRSCIGGRNRKSGQAAQAKGHRALGGVGFTPTNEETHGGYDIRVQVEHKSGGQVPQSFRKFLTLDWTRRAFGQAERAVRVGDGSHPAVMIDGRWLVVDCKRIGPEVVP
jgi:hypothetical protein